MEGTPFFHMAAGGLDVELGTEVDSSAYVGAEEDILATS